MRRCVSYTKGCEGLGYALNLTTRRSIIIRDATGRRHSHFWPLRDVRALLACFYGQIRRAHFPRVHCKLSH
jgi:hypothetical protein